MDRYEPCIVSCKHVVMYNVVTGRTKPLNDTKEYSDAVVSVY